MAKGEIIIFGKYPNGEEKLAFIESYIPMSNGDPLYTELTDVKTREPIGGTYRASQLPMEVDYE